MEKYPDREEFTIGIFLLCGWRGFRTGCLIVGVCFAAVVTGRPVACEAVPRGGQCAGFQHFTAVNTALLLGAVFCAGRCCFCFPIAGRMAGFDCTGLHFFVTNRAELGFFAVFCAGGILNGFPITGGMIAGSGDLFGLQFLAADAALDGFGTLIRTGRLCFGLPVALGVLSGGGDGS